MRRRNRLVTIALVLVAVGGTAGGLGYVLKQDPDYYLAAGAPGPDDARVAGEVVTRLGDLKNSVRATPEWGAAFTAAEVNAVLREHVCEKDGLAGLLPGRFHSPRVAVEGDRVKLAGRLGDGFWSTVLSVEVRAWLVDKEVNTVAVELCGMWAGALPVGSQSVLDRVSEAARDANVDVTWYRHAGHPVGLFRLYAGQPRPPAQLRAVRVGDGGVKIAGRSALDLGRPALPDPPETE